ncbi:MAG: hypothetical protein BKP49_04575 [Treponema sp. CETP13]|nr:MAG: hypothetical protein BKP49_04575 [Treponema sp. CETP13]
MEIPEDKLQLVREGLKTFFIAPDFTLLPEEYLEEYFALGYECYAIDDDPYCSLKAKIAGLIATFNEIILFFFIDRKIQGIYWPQYIKELNAKYKGKVRIGVLYTKRTSSQNCRELEYQYLWDAQLVCGCIPLEYQKTHNFLLIRKVLYANQANGRRKNIRAICDSGCSVRFAYNNETFTGDLRDVSITHFSCVFDREPFEIPIYEKIEQINLVIKGQHLTVDAVHMLRRKLESDTISVFVFRNIYDRKGLNTDMQKKMQSILYSITTENTKKLLDQLFLTIRMRLKNKDNT